MTEEIRCEYTADATMRRLVRTLIDQGFRCEPRGIPIWEITGATVSFDMRYPLVTSATRNLGYRFAPAEAAWILSGDNRLDTIRRYSRFVWEFSDDGHFYSGAYGPKIVDQLTYACDMLLGDRDTRQAIIDVWRPNPRPGRDIPCTLSYQFLIRDRRLHVVQCMRSSDAWLGYPYDVFNATMLAGYVLLLLRTRRLTTEFELGTHTTMIGSSHLYEKDLERAQKFVDDDTQLFGCPEFLPYSFESPQALIDHLWMLASGNFETRTNAFLVEELDRIASHRSTEQG